MVWRLVGRDESEANSPAALALLKEGRDAAPEGFLLDEDTVEMLPRRRLQGRCRLCGGEARLTKEHIPPKASGNTLTARSHTIDEWFLSPDLEELLGGAHQQGGIFGYTLCSDCNSYTGRHCGAEYQRWATIGRTTLESLPHPLQLDQLADPLGWRFVADPEDNGGVSPGLFVRQVLSCFCSLSGTGDLAARHPEMRRIILDQSSERLPPGIDLGLGLYLGPHARMVGPTLQIEPEAGEWRWLMEIAFLPFAFLLVIASNVDEPGIGLMMTSWTELGLEQPQRLEGLVSVGFGWSAYPGDYRSRSAIAAGRSAG